VMVLAFFKGLTHDELAQRTLLPVGTIKTWIRRGLHQLRSCIEI
jgi:RNA polymerase sigma-70 factor (ECF subfamily)